MENILEKIGLVILGGLLTGIGYLLKRHIEQKSAFDAIEKHQNLLMLNKELKEQKVSLSELRKLEEAILNKEKAAEHHSLILKEELKTDTALECDEFITQAEMNKHAYQSFQRADTKLKNVLTSIESYLDKTELETLRKSQDSWKIFREKQAEFASSQYKGGSIESLIYYSELERLTVERAASLQSEIDYFDYFARNNR